LAEGSLADSIVNVLAYLGDDLASDHLIREAVTAGADELLQAI
jgi:hypothetical protein